MTGLGFSLGMLGDWNGVETKFEKLEVEFELVWLKLVWLKLTALEAKFVECWLSGIKKLTEFWSGWVSELRLWLFGELKLSSKHWLVGVCVEEMLEFRFLVVDLDLNKSSMDNSVHSVREGSISCYLQDFGHFWANFEILGSQGPLYEQNTSKYSKIWHFRAL